MLKNLLLATTLASFGSTAALAGEKAPQPRMTAEEIETFSTQSADFQGSSSGIVLPLFLMTIIIIALVGGGDYRPMRIVPE
ncbi:hypothetical protein [Aestuariivita boseongensis]|uniref:hypothetical protein n=1 Tax=Aestuariivita boseongensis TaxID=1470562 RepID=UPI000682FB13|nr:hypothetical protein [Aestuariivita boseongensis]